MKSIYSYVMATRGTVKLLSRGNGYDLGYCYPRQNAKVNSTPDLSTHFQCKMV